MSPNLRNLTRAEAEAAVEAAKRNKQYFRPFDLRDAWRMEYACVGFKDVLRLLQAIVTPEFVEDAQRAPIRLALAVEALVHQFTQLVDAGDLDAVLSRISSLPILYSPDAGVGAPGWREAKSVFASKKIGSKTLCGYRSSATSSARNRKLANLAASALRIINLANAELNENWTKNGESLIELREKAIAVRAYQNKRPGATLTVDGRVYVLADGTAVHWHSWLDQCVTLDVEAAPIDDIVAIVEHVVRDFFALPRNTEADALLQPYLGSGGRRPDAVNEARKIVVRAAKQSLISRRN